MTEQRRDATRDAPIGPNPAVTLEQADDMVFVAMKAVREECAKICERQAQIASGDAYSIAAEHCAKMVRKLNLAKPQSSVPSETGLITREDLLAANARQVVQLTEQSEDIARLIVERDVAIAMQQQTARILQETIDANKASPSAAAAPSRKQQERGYVVKRILDALTSAHIAVTSGTGYDPAKYSSTYSEAAQLIQRLDAELEVAESGTPSSGETPDKSTIKEAADSVGEQSTIRHEEDIRAPSAAPPGWKLVPVELTNRMYEEATEKQMHGFARMWKAALDFAPTAPVANQTTPVDSPPVRHDGDITSSAASEAAAPISPDLQLLNSARLAVNKLDELEQLLPNTAAGDDAASCCHAARVVIDEVIKRMRTPSATRVSDEGLQLLGAAKELLLGSHGSTMFEDQCGHLGDQIEEYIRRAAAMCVSGDDADKILKMAGAGHGRKAQP